MLLLSSGHQAAVPIGNPGELLFSPVGDEVNNSSAPSACSLLVDSPVSQCAPIQPQPIMKGNKNLVRTSVGHHLQYKQVKSDGNSRQARPNCWQSCSHPYRAGCAPRQLRSGV